MSAIIEKNIPLKKIICNICKHRISGIKCKAFENIPDEILIGDNNHSKPIVWQKNKIIFENK